MFTCSFFPLKFLWETNRLHCNSDKITTSSVLSPGSLHRFGTLLICFSGETNSGSDILFCKQEPKYNIIYDFPLWVKCFHCLHLICAGVTRQRFPSNLFLSNVSFCLGAGRKRQDAVKSQQHSQGFRHCFLCQSDNNNQGKNSK